MRALAIARKDFKELPAYFKFSIFLLPAVLVFMVSLLVLASGSEEAATELPNIPDSVFPPGLTDVEKSIFFAVNFMAPPFFLMLATVLPITIAADAFAGERERKTLEALLVLPLSSKDLFFGKCLLPLAYGFGASLSAFAVITAIVKLSFPSASLAMPNPTWLVLVFLAVPAFSLLGILVELIISTRVDRTYYAMQMGSLMILPIMILVVGGVTGVLIMGPMLLLALSGGILLLDYVLIQIGSDSLSKGL